MSEDNKEYFSIPTRQYASYESTSQLCYQILKGLKGTYTFEDYINKDISYPDEKTDLEINRIIIENVKEEKDIPIIGGMLSAMKLDHLIYLFDVVKESDEEYIRIGDQKDLYHSIVGDNGLIYITKEETG